MKTVIDYLKEHGKFETGISQYREGKIKNFTVLIELKKDKIHVKCKDYNSCIEETIDINDDVEHAISDILEAYKVEIRVCEECGGIANTSVCEICKDTTRNNGELCIVADSRDIFLLEESGEFLGKYFVLDSLETLNLGKLEHCISVNRIQEIIFALSPSLGSDSIMLYLEDKLENLGLRFTKIAQGVPTGVSLENVDQLSIIRALQSRVKI